MIFSSFTFIFIFFPLTLICYFLSKKLFKKIEYRNIVLCIFSLIFYSWGEPKYIILMLFSIIINYFIALLIDKYRDKSELFLVLGIIINLVLLGVFKYSNFIILNINNIFNSNRTLPNISLPIGISFYTFQILSYVIDVYRKNVKVQKNVFVLATYISLFPQLVAGPIVRYETVENELKQRNETLSKFIDGLKRFIVGLAKKVIIANNVALIADTIYGSTNSTILLWIAAISYTIQIYFDFSGYSDMAIGIGKMFGFTFLENFNYPYTSTSVTDFWRRWHISLSSFFKDYIYIPLGGNRVSTLKWIRNTFIVWFLTGLWHGASWNFVIWGLYYCVILILEKKLLHKILEKLPKIIQHIYTIFIFVIGWVIFRVENINELLSTLKNMFVYNGINLKEYLYLNTTLLLKLPFILLGIILSTEVIKKIKEKNYNKIYHILLSSIVYVILFYISIFLLMSSSYNPFIYYRF